jgi:hypothetical protein
MLSGDRATLLLVKKWNEGEPNLFNIITVPFQLLTAEYHFDDDNKFEMDAKIENYCIY